MKQLLYLIILLIFATSCEDDFNINGEWEDITIVYGLLNPKDTAHYLKINKSFLGDKDAREMAKEADSIQYSKDLEVKLIEYELIDDQYNYLYDDSWILTGNDLAFTRTNEIPKSDTTQLGNEGTFGTDVNYLYKSKGNLKAGNKYVLNIKVPGKEEVVYSTTYLMKNFIVKLPRTNELSTSRIDLADYKSPYQTTYYQAVYGKIYQVALEFYFSEISEGDTVDKSVVLNYPRHVVDNVRKPNIFISTFNSLELKQLVGGNIFFDKVGRLIPEKEGVRRIAGNVDFIYYVGGNDLNTYINVSEAVVGYGQQKPEYSNIINGVGIFDSRTYTKVRDKQISGATKDSLAYGTYTKKLNFADGKGQWNP